MIIDKVEALDAKHYLAYINSTLCGYTHSPKRASYQVTYLDIPQPLFQFLNSFLAINESKEGEVHGALGVETLMSRVIDFLQDNISMSIFSI